MDDLHDMWLMKQQAGFSHRPGGTASGLPLLSRKHSLCLAAFTVGLHSNVLPRLIMHSQSGEKERAFDGLYLKSV